MTVDDTALLPIRDRFSVYTIYDHPKDHPDYYVLRPWDVIDGKDAPRIAPNGLPVCGLFKELESAREWCAQYGLHRLPRQPGDDPVIVETWI